MIGSGRWDWARLVPDGLAGRFALLLAGALVAVNLVAVALLSTERQRLGREFDEGRQTERLALVVPLIDAAPPADRERIARLARDRFARVALASEPIVDTGEADAELTALTRRTLAALGSNPPDVRAARLTDHPEGGPHGRSSPAGERIALSVLIASSATNRQGRPPEWLNIVARPSRPPPRADRLPFLLVLFLSLAAVLWVGLLFIQRLTRPLAALAEAARAAGRGDRTARVLERGARELRETAQAFNEMQARIARFDAERTRTLVAVGHDLRTPITSLRIRAEMLEEADREPIVRTLEEMAVMADGLVAYARGQGDAEEVATIDLQSLLSRLCTERGADFTPAAPVMVRGRSVALLRAFDNLIDNALRYGSAARVRLEAREGDAVVTIEDDGPGIATERIETMFEPFVRGEASRNLETGGAGLGLSISRSIIRAHGGEAKLRNGPGGGLIATVALPVAKAEMR